MKKNYFIRIFSSYIIIIILVCLLMGYLTIQLFKLYYVGLAEDKLKTEANLIASNFEVSQESQNIDFDYLAKKYSEDINSSVTFISQNGDILGEKIKGSNNAEQLLKQPEMAGLTNGNSRSDYYYDKNTKVYVMNVGKNVQTSSFSGYIHISMPLYQLSNVNQAIFIYSYIGVILILFTTLLLRYLFQKDIINTIEMFSENSRKIDEKGMKERVMINSQDVFGVMANDYNSMLDRLEGHINNISEFNERLVAGIDNIELGLAIINKDNKILLINSTMHSLLNYQEDEIETKVKKVYEISRELKINSFIKNAVDSGIYQETEVELSSGKTLRLVYSPLNDEDNNVKEYVLSAYDMTQIRKVEQMGSDFVSNATHELKTPLTSIKGFIETLKDGAIDSKETSYRFLDIMEMECERLYSLINDILQLAEIQSAKQDANLELYSINDLLSEVISFLDNQAKKKSITIHTDLQHDSQLVLINKNRIKQLFINLIENAIKYTQISGEVFVKSYIENNQIIFKVKDTGIGIPENAIPRLFERFFRVDKGRSRSMGGTGLGLSIVKQIVDLYEGTIDVQSKVGEGTEFTITLPVKQRK